MGKIARKLEIDFLSENPNGIRIVHSASFRHFKAYVIPHSCISDLSQLNLDEKTGIYFLFDEDRTQVYIGQTGNGIGRIQTHHQQKKFWDIAMMFLADKDEWMSLIDELETYAIIRLEKAMEKKSTRYNLQLQNKKKRGRKEESLNRLPEIEEIFRDINFCLAAFEYNIESANSAKKETVVSGIPVLATRGGIKANGLFNPKDKSIVVLKGSEIRYNEKYKYQNNVRMKLDEMFEKECIEKKKEKYILKENVAFEKLSPAAEFVIGGSCNGKTEWKSNGKTLKELFEL